MTTTTNQNKTCQTCKHCGAARIIDPEMLNVERRLCRARLPEQVFVKLDNYCEKWWSK